MSSEQLSDIQATQASDIDSAGMVSCEILTGAPPFRDQRPDGSPWLEQMVLRCLQPQPEQRFQNATRSC